MRKRKFLKIATLFLLLWVICAQSCMQFRISDAKAKKEFAKANVAIQLNTFLQKDCAIHYAQTGNDTLPTIIFIHGSPGSWDAFKKYLKDSDLLKKFRMVSIDRPGFGYSCFGNAKNLAEQTKLILPAIKLIDNKKPIILVGHSLGGPLVAALYLSAPNLFNYIVFLSSSLNPDLENAEKWRLVLMYPPFKYLLPGAFRPSNDELWYLKKDLKILKPQLKNITCPIYIVHGDKDILVPFANVAFMKKEFINAEKINIDTIKGANHFIPWTNYDDIKNILLRLKI